jgi:hypothetical protein
MHASAEEEWNAFLEKRAAEEEQARVEAEEKAHADAEAAEAARIEQERIDVRPCEQLATCVNLV